MPEANCKGMVKILYWTVIGYELLGIMKKSLFF